MKTKLFVGGVLIGLAFGLLCGRALVDGSHVDSSAAVFSLLLAMPGAFLARNAWAADSSHNDRDGR
jgi:hypothetical protein